MYTVSPRALGAEFLAGGGLPEVERLVEAAGRQRSAIGAECHRRYDVGMSGERETQLTGLRVPKPNGFVATGGRERVAVRSERQRPNGARMSLEGRRLIAGRGLP